jgi:hypothetical protein
MKSKYEEYNFEQRVADLKNVLGIACATGNYDANDYMHGMANGLILAFSIMCEPYGKEAPFLSKPPPDIKYKSTSVGEP